GAEGGDGGDADHDDQGQHDRVLDRRRAVLVPQKAGEVLGQLTHGLLLLRYLGLKTGWGLRSGWQSIPAVRKTGGLWEPGRGCGRPVGLLPHLSNAYSDSAREGSVRREASCGGRGVPDAVGKEIMGQKARAVKSPFPGARSSSLRGPGEGPTVQDLR